VNALHRFKIDDDRAPPEAVRPQETCTQFASLRPMKGKNAVFVVFLLFCVVYYIARLAVYAMALSGTQSFEHEVSDLAEAIVFYSFLGIGVIGFALLPGVALRKWWGFWGTMLLSAYTVVWDVWAAIWVQSSAAIGIAPAAIIMGYLLLYRKDFLTKAKTVREEPSAG